MVKYIKLNKKIFNYIKSRLKSQEILIYDKNSNHAIITNDMIENIDLDIICPLILYNENDKIIDKINNMDKFIECKYQLREDQLELINNIMNINNNYSCNSPIYLSLVCPCGYGKTILGIDIISRLKYKCAIIVPRIFIIYQWLDKIKQKNNIFASTCGRKKAIEQIKNGLECDVFICPDKHLENDIIRNYIYNTCSLVIVDEAHRYNANKNIVMTRFLYNKIFKFCLFLTATPSNNMNTFINEFIDINNQSQIKILNDIKKKLIIFNLKDKIFTPINNNCKYYVNKITNNKFNNIYIKNFNYKYCISLDDKRNEIIIDLILKTTTDNTKCLILTDYRLHMMNIYNLLKKTHLQNIIYIYDVKNKKCNDLLTEIKNKNEKFIIISTISACSESLDINNLNTFHVLLPITNSKTIKQCIGRIMRNMNEDKYTYIYNFSNINNMINMYINDKTDLIRKVLSDWECVEIKCSY
ncbi:DNA helicase, transcriptional elongation [Betaentomopoxvirus amoorei]|uniref:AMV059 n=1 Tax=Amsacta moorei entomopoxvirus TaxID=28321 RepID=Q9EMZ0_AMEPV|nr:DNA helicase, transcriptional elongation [Amsacta moorei entomopoxvirus]AAG02765.1 AMV059 [Amsacta moorei entomopoxvirus]